MAAQGPMIWMDRALKKIADGTINLGADTFHAVLLDSSQPINATFTGTSGDARYADLTGELATGNGYTSGGLALTGQALTRTLANTVAWTTATAQWTLTGTLSGVKYFVLIDWTAANKDIVACCDFDTGGGTISPVAPLFGTNPDPTNGWGTLSQ